MSQAVYQMENILSNLKINTYKRKKLRKSPQSIFKLEPLGRMRRRVRERVGKTRSYKLVFPR